MEPGTVFGGRPPAGLPDDEVSYQMQRHCQAELGAAGYAQYETSAYARAGAQCTHNLNYWNFGDYLGVGAGAHGKLSQAAEGVVARTVREREPRRYLARGRDGPPSTTPVSAGDLPFEFMMNALRLVGGFEPALFESRTGVGWNTVSGPIERLAARGLLRHASAEGDRWCPTELGQRFLNDLIAEFLPARPVV
jgi:oxygen-independent coproporphyrinogen-3 oxidase